MRTLSRCGWNNSGKSRNQIEDVITRMPLLDPAEDRELVGMVSLQDLLRARTRNLSEERDRERVIRIRLPFASTVTSGKES